MMIEWGNLVARMSAPIVMQELLRAYAVLMHEL